jgi:hypothetical protein|tara:strand:+ start:4038 stop:4649 length:612 start_codon:yes stop_codon:yes gene_type:complete
MSVGQMFLDKCLDTNVVTDPWPHQIITKTFDDKVFDKLQNQCVPHLNVKTTDIIQIHPKEFKDYNIDFYDETVDICEKLLKNVKQLHDVYPAYRKYPTLGVNAHISITPPLPYKFYIHQEGVEKTWSSVTYVTPKINVGTKMYTEQSESAFVKEAEWQPNTTFIFCGQQGKTWHSYESNQNTNRITFNLFIMKHRSKKCFYPL